MTANHPTMQRQTQVIAPQLWADMHREYVQQGLSGPDLASRHGVSLAVVSRRITDEKWRDQRKQYETAAKQSNLDPTGGVRLAQSMQSDGVPQGVAVRPDDAQWLQSMQGHYLREAELLLPEIRETTDRIVTAETASDYAALVRAKDCQLERLRVMLGIPAPGPLKPGGERRKNRTPAAPLE